MCLLLVTWVLPLHTLSSNIEVLGFGLRLGWPCSKCFFSHLKVVLV